MDSSGMWLGGSLALGIVMIGTGLLLILVSMPLAKGQVRAHQYNYRPIQLYRLTVEEKDRMGKSSAMASMAVALLFVLAGLASVGLGVTGNAGPNVMYLFGGTIAAAVVALLAIMLGSWLWVRRAREKGEAKPPAAR